MVSSTERKLGPLVSWLESEETLNRFLVAAIAARAF